MTIREAATEQAWWERVAAGRGVLLAQWDAA